MEFRLDRMLTLYCASPLLRFVRSGNSFVPILMYHNITDQEESRNHPYYRTATSPAVFAAQLKWLRGVGYTTCSLASALNQLHNAGSAHSNLVVITFDDGYADFYRYAYPLLAQYGFTATVFLPTAYIGDNPVQFKGKECLTWTQIRELAQQGMCFGSHTVTHPQLRDLSARAIKDEIVNSKRTIEDKLGRPVDSFAYPFAFPQTDVGFKKMLRNLLSDAGYHTGVCTVVGRANRHSDPLFLERLPVNSCDDHALFQAKLSGGYDWVAKSQHISKLVKTPFHRRMSEPKFPVLNDLPGVHGSS